MLHLHSDVLQFIVITIEQYQELVWRDAVPACMRAVVCSYIRYVALGNMQYITRKSR